MRVSRLAVYQFRNLRDAELLFCSGLNLIRGRNGQGKTNIVEALSLLSTGKSFRTSKVSETVAWSHTAASLFCDIEREDSLETLGVVLERGTRELLVNGRKTSLVDFVGTLVTITFSPSDIEIVKEGPTARRRFLDKHMVDLIPSHLRHLTTYHHALKHKNALLKSGTRDHRVIEPWNQVMAREAAHLQRARKLFIDSLKDECAELYGEFASTDGGFDLVYEPNIPAYEEEEIKRILDESFERESFVKSSTRGPHRDEMAMSLGGKDARSYASQGQSKSCVIALKLGVVRLVERHRETSPVVLLDDVESELDSGRAQALFDHIFRDGRQVFVTGTTPYSGLTERAQEFREFDVTEGSVTQII